MNDYSKNLPCLQSVGPWWSEEDRRTLFCYLLKIFPFGADFLSASDAASYDNNEMKHTISSIEIKNDFDSFKKKRKSVLCTCTALRRHVFSFGKLNSKICNLCPYSTSYTNHSIGDESRFISYMIKFDPLPLSEISSSLAAGTTDAFVSHVPIYVEDYLIDVIPITIYLEPFLRDIPKCESKCSEEFFQYMREEISSYTIKRISYLRTKQIIESYYPDYLELALHSAYAFFEDIKNACQNIRSVAPNSVRNLYNILSASCHKKHNKKPSTYYDEELSSVSRKMYVLHTFDDAEGKLEIIEEDAIFKLSDDENDPPADQSDLLRELLDADYQSLPALEDHLMQSETILTPDIPVDSNLHVKSSHNSFDESPIDETNIEIVAPEELVVFHEFYTLTNYADIFVYGNGELQTDNGILTAFTENCAYLCMEVVKSGDTYALLMVNPTGEKILYSLEQFGPKAIRNIADQEIPVYTSSRYFLSLYLFRNKVYRLDILDVGIACSLKQKTPISGISSFEQGGLVSSMTAYHELYDSFVSVADEQNQKQLKRLEHYSSLLCSDGENAPFKDMPRLSRGFQLSNFIYTFEKLCNPIREGTFMQIRALDAARILSEEETLQIYMDACIALNAKCPFWEGYIYILKMNTKGLLVYITGNLHKRHTIQLYLSSCIRRTFSMTAAINEIVSIEEQFLDYEFKTKHISKQ